VDYGKFTPLQSKGGKGVQFIAECPASGLAATHRKGNEQMRYVVACFYFMVGLGVWMGVAPQEGNIFIKLACSVFWPVSVGIILGRIE
jgi:hypothetical protein